MALRWGDRILETSVSTGTGALTLAGAVTGYRRFSAIPSIATNDTVYYAIFAVDANGNPSGDWETGLGTYSSANTLTRTTPSASTNAGAAVNFAAGTKWVMATPTAALFASLLTAAVAADLNTGTSTATAVTPDALAGSNFGIKTVTIQVSDPAGSAITTGDGKAYWRVPSTCNGMNLVAVAAALTTVSSSGIPTVQIANVTDGVDILSTKLTIDASETDSKDATAAAVIDASKDDVATGDMLRIDIDVAGTGAKGLMVEMQFQLP